MRRSSSPRLPGDSFFAETPGSARRPEESGTSWTWTKVSSMPGARMVVETGPAATKPSFMLSLMAIVAEVLAEHERRI